MADAALYLASAESSFVTGTEPVVDGGMTAREAVDRAARVPTGAGVV